MASIRNLLNPLPDMTEASESEFDTTIKTKAHNRNDYSPSPQVRKKQKLVKDAAIFTRGPVRGECRYPPHEYQDKLLEAKHEEFGVYPMGMIADYPRRIPYNSEKKSFLEKTGRDSLEVFQYIFKVSGDDTTYSMLWDYNIGLVRTTPLFKCTGHSKTTPAKMLNRNTGLRDICHSITGGALVAQGTYRNINPESGLIVQGYWMPYEAAKAVAATFCWTIRYALTPVFGVDFPDLCLHPSAERYGDMTIDPKIIKYCTQQARLYRDLEQPISRSSTMTPTSNISESPKISRHVKQIRPKPITTAMISPDSLIYDTDISSSREYSLSPLESSYRNVWTPTNTPRSVPQRPPSTPCSPRTNPYKLQPSTSFPKKDILSSTPETEDDDDDDDDSESSSSTSSPSIPINRKKISKSKDITNSKSPTMNKGQKKGVSPKILISTRHKALAANVRTNHHEVHNQNKVSSLSARTQHDSPRISNSRMSDVKAAYVLLSLRMQEDVDTIKPKPKISSPNTKHRRRAST